MPSSCLLVVGAGEGSELLGPSRKVAKATIHFSSASKLHPVLTLWGQASSSGVRPVSCYELPSSEPVMRLAALKR
eukprot:6049934-Pyramimonas_sp.AAC.1